MEVRPPSKVVEFSRNFLLPPLLSFRQQAAILLLMFTVTLLFFTVPSLFTIICTVSLVEDTFYSEMYNRISSCLLPVSFVELNVRVYHTCRSAVCGCRLVVIAPHIEACKNPVSTVLKVHLL